VGYRLFGYCGPNTLGKISGLGRAVSFEVVLNPRGAFREEIELKKSFVDVALLVPYQRHVRLTTFKILYIYFLMFFSKKNIF